MVRIIKYHLEWYQVSYYYGLYQWYKIHRWFMYVGNFDMLLCSAFLTWHRTQPAGPFTENGNDNTFDPPKWKIYPLKDFAWHKYFLGWYVLYLVSVVLIWLKWCYCRWWHWFGSHVAPIQNALLLLFDIQMWGTLDMMIIKRSLPLTLVTVVALLQLFLIEVGKIRRLATIREEWLV